RSHSAHSGNFVFMASFASFLGSLSPALVRRWAGFFLDRSLLAYNCHRAPLVCSRILHGDLFRALGMVLRFGPTTRNKRGTAFNQMGPDVSPGRPGQATTAIIMDEIDK